MNRRLKLLKKYLTSGFGIWNKFRVLMVLMLFYQRFKKFNYIGKYIVITHEGIKFMLPDITSFFIIHSELELENYLKNKLKPGNVFLDVGAHIGKYTLLASRIVGKNGFVYAVEPSRENLIFLRKNLKLNKINNVRILPIAAWYKKTRLSMFNPGGSGGRNIKSYGKREEYVIADRLDNIVKSKVDFAKIDVEGAEYEVLLGMEKIIEKYRPTLAIEILDENKAKVFNLLQKYSYKGRKLWRGIGQEYWVFEAKKWQKRRKRAGRK